MIASKINAKIKNKTFQVRNIRRTYIIVSDYSQEGHCRAKKQRSVTFYSFPLADRGVAQKRRQKRKSLGTGSLSAFFLFKEVFVVRFCYCLFICDFWTEEENEDISSAVCILKPLKAGDNILLCTEKFLRIRNCSNFLQNIQILCRLLFLLIVPGRDQLNQDLSMQQVLEGRRVLPGRCHQGCPRGVPLIGTMINDHQRHVATHGQDSRRHF